MAVNGQGVISVRFGPEEVQALRARAAELDLSVSAYLRHIASRDAILSRPGARRFTASSGADVALCTNMEATS